MRTLLVMSVLVSSVVLAQQPPQRSKEEMLKEAKRISDLMNKSEQKPVVLTPPEQLFKKGKATLLYALPINKPAGYREYLRFVSDEGLLKEAVATVNGLVELPRDITVFFRDCA